MSMREQKVIRKPLLRAPMAAYRHFHPHYAEVVRSNNPDVECRIKLRFYPGIRRVLPLLITALAGLFLCVPAVSFFAGYITSARDLADIVMISAMTMIGAALMPAAILLFLNKVKYCITIDKHNIIIMKYNKSHTRASTSSASIVMVPMVRTLRAGSRTILGWAALLMIEDEHYLLGMNSNKESLLNWITLHISPDFHIACHDADYVFHTGPRGLEKLEQTTLS